MTPKRTDQQIRRDLVLGIVVDHYIKNISPISSSYIAQEFTLDLSPATIRNILAELEEMGYLTHPHTSAGRVPTQNGYRYYVDHLMHEIQLLEEERAQIRAQYQKQVLELEQILERTTDLISRLTHYTTLVSIDGLNQLYCKGTNYVVGYPEYQDIDKIQNILSALEEKERILEIINQSLEHRIEIYIGEELHYNDISGCSLAISQFQTEKGPSGRIAVLGPTRMDYKKVVSTLQYVTEIMNNLI